MQRAWAVEKEKNSESYNLCEVSVAAVFRGNQGIKNTKIQKQTKKRQ